MLPECVDEKKEALNKLTGGFCDKHLTGEVKSLCEKMILKLSRKRPSPLQSGSIEVWASAVIWAIARVNFFHDPASGHHISLQTVCDFFNTNKSTVGQKATALERLLKIQLFDPAYSTSDRQKNNPLNNFKLVNGFIVPINFPEDI